VWISSSVSGRYTGKSLPNCMRNKILNYYGKTSVPVFSFFLPDNLL
jgi:hypothetical protein